MNRSALGTITVGLLLSLPSACGSGSKTDAVSGGGSNTGGANTAGASTGGTAGSGGAAAGSSGTGGVPTCTPGSKQCSGARPDTCSDAGVWVSGTDCPFVCAAGACAGVCKPGQKQCKGSATEICSTAGEWQSGEACPYGCDAGACKPLSCKPGEYTCFGNQVQECDPGPPAKWVTKSTCDPSTGHACFAPTGTCVYLQPLPPPATVGTCHVYATFNTTDGVFKGGYDVDSFGDMLYTTRSGIYLDVYQVKLEDTDGDGVLEPDQHPDNLLHPGPMEKRTLAFVQSYSKMSDNVPVVVSGAQELYAKSDRVFIAGSGQNPGTISEYVFATKASTLVVGAPPVFQDGGYVVTAKPRLLGFGDVDGVWYGWELDGSRVVSWHAPTSSWVAELKTSLYAGGLEVVVAPKTGQQFLYATSVNTGDLDQYRRAATGWVHENRFKLANVYSVGLGFGAFDHFWITSGGVVLEVGGGDCAQYLK